MQKAKEDNRRNQPINKYRFDTSKLKFYCDQQERPRTKCQKELRLRRKDRRLRQGQQCPNNKKTQSQGSSSASKRSDSICPESKPNKYFFSVKQVEQILEDEDTPTLVRSQTHVHRSYTGLYSNITFSTILQECDKIHSCSTRSSIQAFDKFQQRQGYLIFPKRLDGRTTVMIKNIPNKYDLTLILQEINQNFDETYDFFYLPQDKKNQCNVGYAFINFVDFSIIPSFYQAFNARKWSKFNSKKICQLSYARIQGRQALIEHFKNSVIMKDKKLKPIIKNNA